MIERTTNLVQDPRKNPALNGGKKQFSKANGKGISLTAGPKVKLNVLKPCNDSRMGSCSKNPFKDGSKMGPNLSTKDQGPITFTAVGHGLDKSKHIAVNVASGKGVDWNLSHLTGTSVSGFSDKAILDFSNPTADMECGENFGQVPLVMEEGDSRLLPVDKAMVSVVSSLCKEVRNKATTNSASADMSDVVHLDA